MNKKFEYILIGVGFLMFSFSILFWITILASPFLIAYWYVIGPKLSSWTPMDTFGVFMALGLVSFIYFIATWGDKKD